MKKNFFFLLYVLLMSSCAQVLFTSPQPLRGVSIKTFDQNIRGEYADSVLNITILENELFIGDERYRLSTRKPSEDEVQVKFYKNFYFASFLSEEYYEVFMAGFFDDKLALYMLNADAYSLDILSRFVKVDTLCAESEIYLIDASRREFDAIIENELFDVLGVLSRVEE